MSDHSIIIDMRYPQGGRFECNAADGSKCKVAWDCECEYIWKYQVVDSKPQHHDSDVNGEVHVGRFENDQCNLTDWYDNQEEDVEGKIRVDVSPVNEIDYVTFTATAARIEKDS